MSPHNKKRQRAAASVKEKDWLVGDLVLAKVRGHRPWPAQIRKSEDYGYHPQQRKIFVTFFGSEEVGFCSYNKIILFTRAMAESLVEQRRKMNTNLEFKRAIREIIVAYDEMNMSTEAHGSTQRKDAEMVSEMYEDEQKSEELPQFFPQYQRRPREDSQDKRAMNTSTKAHGSNQKRDSQMVYKRRREGSQDKRAMNTSTKAHGSNQKGDSEMVYEMSKDGEKLSDFFTGCPGSATEGSLKGGPENPSRQPSRYVNSIGNYCHEETENKDWYEYICEHLEKRIVRRKIEITVETLMKQISRTIPIRTLERISESHIIQDAKGRSLLFFLKNALRVPVPKDPARQGLNALQAFVKVHKPPRPSKHDQRYRHREIPKGHGVHHLCFWHGIGRTAKEGVLSKHIIGVAGYKNNAVKKFLNAFTPITQAVGALFDAVDHKNYQRYNEQFHKIADNTAASFLRTTKRNCFLGMAVITGLWAGPHRDDRDADDGWVANLCFGDFEGGYLQVPQLGQEFVLRPGDVVFMRSRLLQHSISKITSGLRFGVVYFTHKTMMPKPLPE